MIFDYEKAMAVVGDDKSLFAELFQIFLEDKDSILEQIEMSIKQSNREIIERQAHSLKGALSNLGAGESVEAALHLEQIALNADLEKIENVYNNLKNQVADFVNEVNKSEAMK